MASRCAARKRSRSRPDGRPPEQPRVACSEAAAGSAATRYRSDQTAPSSPPALEVNHQPDDLGIPFMSTEPSLVALGQPEHALGDVAQDQLLADRRDARDHDFAQET